MARAPTSDRTSDAGADGARTEQERDKRNGKVKMDPYVRRDDELWGLDPGVRRDDELWGPGSRRSPG